MSLFGPKEMIFAFFALFFPISSAKVVGIDLGTQYVKFAESTFSGGAVPLKIDGTRSSILSSAAFKQTNFGEGYKFDDINTFEKDLFDRLELKVGKAALSIIEKNKSLGYRFLPYSLSRDNNTECHGHIASPMVMMALYLIQVLRPISIEEGVTISVPAYWTNPQRLAVAEACQFIGLPLKQLIDDATALTALFSSTRSGYFKDEPYKVLFVDIGGLSVKCYGIRMQWNGKYTDAFQTSMSYSENAGGFHMANIISKSKKIKFKKAEKLLYKVNERASSDDPEAMKEYDEICKILKKQIDIIKNVISDSMKQSKETFAKINEEFKFNEVQLIGGASQLKFLPDLIKKTTKIPVIKRDLNPNEAISLGAVHFGAISANLSPYPPGKVFKIPSISMNVTCGDTNFYCEKGKINCTSEVMLFNTTGCNEVTINANPKEVPYLSSPIMARYKLKNISKVDFFDFNYIPIARFTMKSPLAQIEEISWCEEFQRCIPVDFEPVLMDNYEYNKTNAFIRSYHEVDNERYRKNKLIEMIHVMVDKLDLLINNEDDTIKVEIRDDIRQKIDDIIQQYESGSLITLPIDSLDNIYSEFHKICQELGVKP